MHSSPILQQLYAHHDENQAGEINSKKASVVYCFVSGDVNVEPPRSE